MMGRAEKIKEFRRTLRRNQTRFAVETLRQLQKSGFKTRFKLAWRLVWRKF